MNEIKEKMIKEHNENMEEIKEKMIINDLCIDNNKTYAIKILNNKAISENIINYYSELSNYGINFKIVYKNKLILFRDFEYFIKNNGIYIKLENINENYLDEKYSKIKNENIFLINDEQNMAFSNYKEYEKKSDENIITIKKNYQQKIMNLMAKKHNFILNNILNNNDLKSENVAIISNYIKIPLEIRFNFEITDMYLRTLPDLYDFKNDTYFEIKIKKINRKSLSLEFSQLFFNYIMSKNKIKMYYLIYDEATKNILFLKPEEILSKIKYVYFPYNTEEFKIRYKKISLLALSYNLAKNVLNLKTKIVDVKKDIFASNYPYCKLKI